MRAGLDIFSQLKSEMEMRGNYNSFNITIIPWWLFISHGLGTLVKAGYWKSNRLLFFFVSERGTCLCFDLSEECFVCSLYYVFFFFLSFSAMSESDSQGKVTQSALQTQKRAFTGFCDFLGGNHNLKCPLRPLKSCWQLSLMWFLSCWEKTVDT